MTANLVAGELAALALRSMAAGDATATTVSTLVHALSSQLPRCLVGIWLHPSVMETARAGSAVELPKQELMRLVWTGKLQLDPRAIPPAHQNCWVEPLRGFLDATRYASSPVGRLMAAHGVFYFGRYYVCDGGRLVATIGAWLPHGLPSFTAEEVTVLSASATALAPLLRLHALADRGAAYERAVMLEAERRGQAAFLIGLTGIVIAASPAGEALLAAHPGVRSHVERFGAEPPGATREQALPKLGLRLSATALPTAYQDHRLVTVAPLAGDGVESLTARQRELLDHVEHGLTNREIGLVMGVSATTVKTMLQRLYAQTSTSGRMELVRWRRGVR